MRKYDRSPQEFKEEFFPALGVMFSKFLAEAQNNKEKLSIMMERMIHVLGIMTAVASEGDPKSYDEISMTIQAMMDKKASGQLAYLKKLQDNARKRKA